MIRKFADMFQPIMFARGAALLACLSGLVTLAGWTVGNHILVRLHHGFAPMKPNTAFALIACGIVLLLRIRPEAAPWRHAAGRVLAGLIAGIGTITLLQYVSGWNSGLDTWIFAEALQATGLPHSGRMTHAAAFNFILLGFALGALDFEPRRGLLPAQHAALLSSLIGLLALLGYVYGMYSLYSFFAYSSMALHTSITFSFLGLGVMMARPGKGLMSVVTSPHGGGMMARRLLPAAVLLPAALGWLRLQGELIGLYDGRFGLALFASSNIITFVILVWLSARGLNRLDTRRQRAHETVLEAERGLRDANNLLQREVAEHKRTEQARRLTERQLQQSQKMEAMGTLAGGIAHDFNNILTAIFLNADRARKNLPEDSPVRKNLEEISRAGTRAADLVRRIMTFGRQTEPDLQPLDLRHSVEDSLELLRLSLPPNVQLATALTASLPPVAADATQIHQILLNLGTNAIHAMEEKGGILDIRLDLVHVSHELADLLNELREGPHIRLAVGDNGKGMEKAVLERVYDPFFTTKPPGVGTGLGLSVVHGIMKAHRGCVTVYSEPGRGTIFHLYFPVAGAGTGNSPASDISPRGSGERLLYVDDEPVILSAAAEMLEGLGYRVAAYEDPRAALAGLQADPDAFDLLLTDFSMPGLSGLDLAREALKVRPGIPVVVC